MMRKKIIALATIGCASCLFASLVNVKASAQTIENDGKFYSIPGASILLSNKTDGDADTNGIRFSYEMSVETYKSLVVDMSADTKVWKDGVNVTAYIVPTNRVEDTSATTIIADADTAFKTISADKWRLQDSEVQEDEEVYVSYAYMYDFPKTEFKKELASCAQIVTEDETLTTSVQVRSMEYVATAALVDYDYGSKDYTSCLNYLETYELTLGDTVYTAAKGAKLKGLPTAPANSAWTLTDGTVLTADTVWNYTEAKVAYAYFDATKIVTPITLEKYDYAQGTAPTVQSFVDPYNIGNVTAVYTKDDLSTNLLDANGKMNVTDVAFGEQNLLVKAGEVYYEVTASVYSKVLKQADVANFKTIIESDMEGYYLLGGNLDFTDVTMTSIGRGADPKNTDIMHFTGTFDGKGYAMTGLSISTSSTPDDYYRASVFSYVEGTIKNVYVEYNAPANWRAAAFVGDNYGAIENLYVKTTINHTSPTGYTAAIVSRNYGTLRNCVGEIELGYSASEGLKVATVVGTNYTTLANVPNYCYGVTNGIEMTYNTDGEGICNWYTNAKNKATNSKNVLTLEDLVFEDFSSENGWSKYWKAENYALYFGEKLIKQVNVTKVLMQDDVANFKTIIESNMAGYYIFGEDLDFTGVTLQPICAYSAKKVFSGTLNGLGYAMTGITLSTTGGNYDGALFGTVTGTIKNVYIEYTAINKQGIGVVTENKGLIENVYAKAIFNSVIATRYSGPVVGWNNAAGKIRNCVGEIAIAEGVATTGWNIGTVLGYNYASKTDSMVNCYGITNGVTLTYRTTTFNGVCNESNQNNQGTNCKNVADRNALSVEDFSVAKGWSSYWQVKADGLYFGNTLISANA